MPPHRKTKSSSKKKKKSQRSSSDDDDDDKAIIAESANSAIRAKAGNNGRVPHKWYQTEVARIQAHSQYRHLDLSKVENDIKNKVRSLEQEEKKRVKEEATRIAAAVAAVSAPPAPPSRGVASSNAEVVVSATAAVARGAARVSLYPRYQSSSREETARGAATSNAEVAASSNVASRSSTAGLDTLALVAANMSTAGSTSSTSRAVALLEQMLIVSLLHSSHSRVQFLVALARSIPSAMHLHWEIRIQIRR